MTTSVAERLVPSLDIDTAINTAAADHGITLEPPRLQQLVIQAVYLKGCEQNGTADITSYTDIVNDVKVEPPKQSDVFGDIASKIDFAPEVDGNSEVVSGNQSATPEHITRITLLGLRGLQNYALLVVAGFIQRPGFVHGLTNPTMAIIAERAGMFTDIARNNPDNPEQAHKQMRKCDKLDISATFDELSAHVFSPETQRLEKVLALRLAAQKPAGELALAAK